jgi:protein gp37
LLGPLVHNPFYPQDWRPLSLVDIDWLIVGGESGPGHRRMDREWVRDLLCTCIDMGRHHYGDPAPGRPAFFFKQWGGLRSKSGGRELDGRTWDEMPERQAVPA